MSNIKVNGNTYNDIERIRLTSADGGTVDFCDAAAFDALLSGDSFDLYNTAITTLKCCRFPVGKFTANFPNVTEVGASCFMSSTVTEVRLPSVQSLGGTAFGSAASLEKCVLSDKLTSILTSTFYGASKMTALVLPYNGVVSLVSNAFTNSAVASGTGYVYVPSAQVEAYKADAVWSTYANQIRAIEDYPDEVA